MKKHYTKDGLMTFDAATMDSTGSFLIGELERLDQTLHMPLASVTWSRDIDLREDVSIADEVSSFTNSTFAAVGGTSPTGKAWIGKNSNAIAGMSLDIGKTANPLNLWGMEIAYTIPELQSAIQLGRPIDSQKLAGMQLKYQMDVDQQVYVGDTQLNLTGLFNSAAVTATNVPNGATASPLWANKTAQEILKDVRAIEVACWTASGYAIAPRQLRVPPSQMVALLQPLAIGGVVVAESILQYVARNSLCLQQNGVPLDIQSVKWLVGAGAGSTDRMVVYTKEYDKVRFPLVPLQRTPLEYRGIYQLTNYFGRIGVVENPYPETVRYADGI